MAQGREDDFCASPEWGTPWRKARWLEWRQPGGHCMDRALYGGECGGGRAAGATAVIWVDDNVAETELVQGNCNKCID